MSSDLQFLLSEHEVPAVVEHRLATGGYRTMATFAVLADDRATLRRTIAADFVDAAEGGLTAPQATGARLIMTQIIAAWM